MTLRNWWGKPHPTRRSGGDVQPCMLRIVRYYEEPIMRNKANLPGPGTGGAVVGVGTEPTTALAWWTRTGI